MAGFLRLLPSWYVMSCNVADMYRRFRGISCLLRQNTRLRAWHHIPEENNLHITVMVAHTA